MKRYKLLSVLLISLMLLSIGSCKESSSSQDLLVDTSIVVKTKSEKLAAELFKDDVSISALTAPKVIKAGEVYGLLDKNIHIIDVRGAKDYAAGHIKNSVNIKMSEALDYAQAKGFPMYDKIIMICYTGQSASYTAAIFQMLGHDNVYVLEWGMCGWNTKFSKKWKKNISDKGIENLVTTSFPKNETTELPVIKSKKNSGPEILYTRARKILKDGFGKMAVNYSYTNANSKKAYVISYQPEALYNAGHIDNAVLYNQKDSFNLSTDLLTLPTDKTIVVYSNKAYQSTYIAVYLKMLGYNARTLKYGANSFMNSTLKTSGDAFSDSVIKNYPFETIKYIEVKGEVQEGGC